MELQRTVSLQVTDWIVQSSPCVEGQTVERFRTPQEQGYGMDAGFHMVSFLPPVFSITTHGYIFVIVLTGSLRDTQIINSSSGDLTPASGPLGHHVFMWWADIHLSKAPIRLLS